MTVIPTVITSAGLQPIPPADLRATLVALVAATNPGYTANLPGALIEDIASTDVGALTLIDQARVDLVNSVSPYAANPFLLNQLGTIYGVTKGVGSNTSVYCVFSGTVGFVLPRGFTVTDGTYLYVIQDGGVIDSSGSSLPLFCLATQAGTWAVPVNTVTTLTTSVPGGFTVTVTNPTEGIPGATAQTEQDYRAQVVQAGYAIVTGIVSTLKTNLAAVPGVQQRLVSVRQVSTGWEIIVGGGDPYQVADAIFRSMPDFRTISGSVMAIGGITKASPGVVQTILNHGYSNGQTVTLNGVVGMTQVNGNSYVVTVVDDTHFSIGVNTGSFGTYVSGGVVTPNLRNITVSLSDYPDVYAITFVVPPQQTVRIGVEWNTSSLNFVNPSAVAQLGGAALVSYINAIPVGVPINLFELQTVFMESVASILAPQLLTRMLFTVIIDDVVVPPQVGTGIISGDPESFFLTNSALVAVVQA